MKIVQKEEEFETLFSTAKSEAMKYFGNDEVYIEKIFSKSKTYLKFKYWLVKIELFIYMKEIVQFKEDIKKLIEETPSPVLK